MKRVSKKWLTRYFGLSLKEINKDLEQGFGKTNIPIFQFDGGKGTLNYDVPNASHYLLIHQSNSKTYYAIQKKEARK